MASPFQFFRKYQAGIMVVLVVLSMLLFTLDSLFTDPGANTWLFGLLIGGAIFGVAGAAQGRWLQWGLGGAVAGALFGLVLPSYVNHEGIFSGSSGTLSESRFRELSESRAVANQFLAGAAQTTGLTQFIPPRQISYGQATPEAEVHFGYLMQQEARELGLDLSDEAINDFINDATFNQLTGDDFRRVRESLSYQGKPLTDDTLFDILKKEVRGQLAFSILSPNPGAFPPPPEEFWAHFRRLNVRQQINIAGVEVDSFLDQVADPTDAEVEEFFREHAEKRPNTTPGAPGFRQFFKAQLAYLELRYADAEKLIEPVTDADIEAFYEENKETLYRTPVIPDSPAEPDTPGADDSADPENTNESAENAPAETSTPEPTSTEATAPESEQPAPPEQNQPADAPAPAQEPETPAATEEPEAPAETPAPEASADDNLCGFDEPAQEAANAADAPTETAPAADAAPVGDEPQADPEAAATQPAPQTTEPTNAAQTAADEAAAAPPIMIPAAPTEDELAQPEIRYETRELDDELKSEIRDDLTRRRTLDLLNERMQAALEFMQDVSTRRAERKLAFIEENPDAFQEYGEEREAAEKSVRDSMRQLNSEFNKELQQYAEENGLKFVVTPLITFEQLQDDQEYPIGTAVPVDSSGMSTSNNTLSLAIYRSFDNNSLTTCDSQLYIPNRGARLNLNLDEGAIHYAVYPIDYEVDHVPTLDEAGVREQVVLAWKRSKARELAEKRAEELRDLVTASVTAEGEDAKSMAAALEGVTVTGKEDGPGLTVRQSTPFSWMRRSLAPGQNFRQSMQSELSEIRFEDGTGSLRKAGHEFMEAIFTDTADEEVTVVGNMDRTIYYVVQPTNRFPTPGAEEQAILERFLREGSTDAFSQSALMQSLRSEVTTDAQIAWQKSIWNKYGVGLVEDEE